VWADPQAQADFKQRLRPLLRAVATRALPVLVGISADVLLVVLPVPVVLLHPTRTLILLCGDENECDESLLGTFPACRPVGIVTAVPLSIWMGF
jgi:hypothetical protein